MGKFENRLKELREKAGYSQQELAEQLHVSRSRIGMYEQGKRKPDPEMQELIADFFNVNLDYLFGRQYEPAAINPDILASDEMLLLKRYRRLNQAGKDKASDYLLDLSEQTKYLKGDTLEESSKVG